MGVPLKSSIYRWFFHHYKPSILGYPHLWKPPYTVWCYLGLMIMTGSTCNPDLNWFQVQPNPIVVQF